MATNFYNIPELEQNAPFNVVADVNAGLEAVDSAIHSVETKIPDVSKIDSEIGAVETKVLEAQATAGQAYSTAQNAQNLASTANANVEQVQAFAETNAQSIAVTNQNLNKFEQAFNFTEIATVNASNLYGTSGVTGTYTLAQNSNGSIFKFYSHCNFNSVVSKPFVSIPGTTNLFGIDSGLALKTTPAKAFKIETSGLFVFRSKTTSNLTWADNTNFAVGTDGHIYLHTSSTGGTWTSHGSSDTLLIWDFPCVYFAKDFGDL